MAHDFDDIIAELDAAKAGLARSVKRSRAFLADRRAPAAVADGAESEKSAFDWRRGEDR